MHANEIAERVTNSVISALESGDVGAWVRPWKSGLPRCAKTGRFYSGINLLQGLFAAQAMGFGSSMWATYQQWKELGAQVRKGAKGTHMVLCKRSVKHPGTDDERVSVYFSTFVVFNADQVDSWTEPALENPVEEGVKIFPVEEMEAFVAATGAKITWNGNGACYIPARDMIEMPARARFYSETDLFSVVFHELAHWTGAPSRLNRDLSGKFGSDLYAMEELVAELTAAMLCSHWGVSPTLRQDHVAYLHHWLKVLKADAKAILTVAGKASQAMEYLLQGKQQVLEAA